MSDIAIPSSIAEVTPSWITEVLKSTGLLGSGSASVLRPTQIGQGVGIMGDIHRVALTYEGDAASAPASLVVKLPSSFESNRAQGVALSMYENEVRFYSELADRTDAALPVVHFAAIESGTAEFVIVMEDLSACVMVDQAEGMTPEQAVLACEAIADIHAAWWDRVGAAELDWIPTMNGPRIAMVDEMLAGLWPVFLDRFAQRIPAGAEEVGELFAKSYLRLMSRLAERSPWTLVHQDYRIENVMFGPDHVTIIDWQGLGRGPAAYDLAYILSGSMQPDARRAHEDELVGCYHARLLSKGVTGYEADQLRADYALAQCLGGLATSVFSGATLDLSNERGFELIATMANRHFTAALDHGGTAIMQ